MNDCGCKIRRIELLNSILIFISNNRSDDWLFNDSGSSHAKPGYHGRDCGRARNLGNCSVSLSLRDHGSVRICIVFTLTDVGYRCSHDGSGDDPHHLYLSWLGSYYNTKASIQWRTEWLSRSPFSQSRSWSYLLLGRHTAKIETSLCFWFAKLR